MDEIIIEGKPLMPESFDFLSLIVTRGRKFYNMCRNKKVPQERLNLLRDYIERAQKMDQEQKMANAPQMQGGTPQPMASEAGMVPPPTPQGPQPMPPAAAQAAA